MPKKIYFHFQDGTIALEAMTEWWKWQDSQSVQQSKMDYVDDYRSVQYGTDVSVSNLQDQRAFRQFLGDRYAGRYTEHSNPQVVSVSSVIFS